MSLVITFSNPSRWMQSFELRHIEGGLSYTRTSYKSTSNRWFAFTTNAYLTTNGTRDGALRQSSEHMNFSMGKSSEKFDFGDEDLYDSTVDDVYDYEAEMTLLHGDGVYTPEVEHGSGPPAQKYTSWPLCDCGDWSCIASRVYDEVPF